MAITDEIVAFVGGQGTKAGSANATYVRQDRWLANGENLDTIMGPNGEVKYSTLTGIYNGVGTVTAVGDFAVDLSQTFAYVYTNDPGVLTFTDGFYIITASHADWLQLDGPPVGDVGCQVGVYIGGAFPSIQEATDAVPDATGALAEYTLVTINTNKDETIAVPLDPACTGTPATNSWVVIKGYNTAPGDMDYGGTYWSGPLQTRAAAVAAGTIVDIDFDANGYLEMDGDDVDNMRLENFAFYNADVVIAAALLMQDNPSNITCNNCKFGGPQDYGAVADGSASTFIRCRFEDDITSIAISNTANSIIAIGCLFDLGAAAIGISGALYLIACGNVFIGGTYALLPVYIGHIVSGNTFYNQTLAAIRLTGSTGIGLVEYGNLFYVANIAADYAIQLVQGSVIYSDYSACNRAAGAFYNMTEGDNVRIITETDADKLFADKDNEDFRPLDFMLFEDGLPGINYTNGSDLGPCGAVGKPSLYYVIHRDNG